MSIRRFARLLLFSLLLLSVLSGCRGRRGRALTDSGPSPVPTDGGLPPADAGEPADDAGEPVGRDAGPVGRDSGPACPEGYSLCGDECADLAYDMNHCGSCFARCDSGELCAGGSCTLDCTPSCGGAECGPDGCGGTCGGCGTGETCADGTCEPTCPTGTTLCGSACVDTTSDSANCGFCGYSCSSGTTCTAGTCSPIPTGGGETCLSAMPLTSSRTFTFTGGSADHTPFSCGNTAARTDKAFAWTAPRSGSASFGAAGVGTEVDTTLAVFSSSSCGSTTQLGCDDDGGTGLHSLLSLTVTAGTTYYVVVSHYESVTPTTSVQVSVTGP